MSAALRSPDALKTSSHAVLHETGGRCDKSVIGLRTALLGAHTVRVGAEQFCLLQWAGSCWYYLRYIDPGNAGALVDPEAEKYWMPVDLYVGGAEHAVLHLLYARFWHKVRHPDVLMKCAADPAQSGPWLNQHGTTGTVVVAHPWK